jgi:hypothetical protein
MKKTGIMLLVLFTGLSAFSLDMSAGVGGRFSTLSSSLNMSQQGNSIKENVGSVKGFGLFGFFDITYAEADINFLYNLSDDYYYHDAEVLGLGLYGKYPFYFNKITLFPLVGLEYQIHIKVSPEYYDKDEMNSFWVKMGGGVNYSVTDVVYINFSFRYGYKFNSVSENRTALHYRYVNAWYFTHGSDIRIALGYRL